MFNFIKKIKFKILKKRILNYINIYGKSETLKNILDVIDFTSFHEHDFKNQSNFSNDNCFNVKNDKQVEVVSKTKKVLITQCKNQENNFNENVNF